MRLKQCFILIIMIIFLASMDMAKESIHLSSTKTQIENLQQSIKTAQNIFDKKKMKPVSMVLNKTKITDILLQLANSSRLSLQFISVTENVLGTFYNLNVEMRLAGNFQQMTEFIKEISMQCFPFLIESAEIIKNDERLDLKFKLIIFNTYCKSKSENILFHKTQTIKKSIELYSIQKMKYVGFMQYDNHFSAILVFPNGETREVLIGDFIGLEHAKIIHIDEEKMLLHLNEGNVSIKKY